MFQQWMNPVDPVPSGANARQTIRSPYDLILIILKLMFGGFKQAWSTTEVPVGARRVSDEMAYGRPRSNERHGRGPRAHLMRWGSWRFRSAR